jgi:hypothetical protein
MYNINDIKKLPLKDFDIIENNSTTAPQITAITLPNGIAFDLDLIKKATDEQNK